MHKSHASHDFDSRLSKAQNILYALERYGKVSSNSKVLNIGTGSGIMDSYIGNKVRLFSVDVTDERQNKNNYRFKKVKDTLLPFPSNYFDFIISNQTIEHIFPFEKLRHLKESYRVLKRGGIMYLATPNKYSLIEPHYKLPALSFLPKLLANFMVKKFRSNDHYDVSPLSYLNIKKYSEQAGFIHKNILPLMIKDSKFHKSGLLITILKFLPYFLIDTLTWLSPSFVIILKK